MKKLSVVLFALILGLVLPRFALAEAKMVIQNVIPERFGFMVITDADPSTPLDKEAILQIVKENFEKKNFKFMQYIIYDEGQHPGSGVFRAFGEMTNIPNKEVVDFRELPKEDYEKNKEVRILTEKIIGNYEIEPKELWEAYSDNEVVADDDFKGKGIMMIIKVPGVAKDFSGAPYIKIPAEKNGISGVHLQLAKDDPLLRSIKKGSKILVRGLPQGMMMKDVMVKAEILEVLE